jgi:uncharacterized protein (TIGR02594 family)
LSAGAGVVDVLLYITPFTLAQRFTGLAETPGAVHNPAILGMLQLVDRSVHDDETPWCSAFVNYVAWLLDAPRSKSLAARSWLRVGAPVALNQARPGYDVVVLSRGANAPGADVLAAPGHVGFFAGYSPPTQMVRVLGGNQSDQVCSELFPVSRVLGVRRLA